MLEFVCRRIENLKLNQWIYILCLVAVLACVLHQLQLYSESLIFAHDELNCLGGYGGKLETEGRWVNYILFPFLSILNPFSVLCFNYLMFGVFSYILFRNYTEKNVALIAAAVALALPPVCLLNQWPLTMCPSFALLLLAGFARKQLKPLSFFILFGILFNGVLSHFYFVLPLLFVNEKLPVFFKTLLWWVLGYVVGFFIAELVTLAVCGTFIHLSDWREPHYVQGIDDVVRYVAMVRESLTLQLKMMGGSGVLIVGGAMLLLCLRIKKEFSRCLIVVICSLLVALAAYAQSFPAGLKVAARTLLCLHFSVLFLIVLAMHRNVVLISVCCMLFGGRLTQVNDRQTTVWNAIGNRWIQQMRELPYNPAEVSAVAMVSTDDDFKSNADRIKTNLEMYSYTPQREAVASWYVVPKYLGYGNVYDGKNAEKLLREKDIHVEDIVFSDSKGYYHALCDGVLVIKIKPTGA